MNNELFSAYSSLNSSFSAIPSTIPNSFGHLRSNIFLPIPNSIALFFAVLFIVVLFIVVAVAASLFTSSMASASNLYLEQKISQALLLQLDKKEIIWLTSNNSQKTLALYRRSEINKELGAAIILAQLNWHPDWPQIIHPLRENLPRFGWHTLSIQMPIKESNSLNLELESIYDTAQQRISAAIDYLTNEDIKNIVLIGQGDSASIAIRYVIENKKKTEAIRALVGISSFNSNWIKSSYLMRNLSIAFLDVIAQYDTISVLTAAKKRLTSAMFFDQNTDKVRFTPHSNKIQELIKNKTGNLQYRQAVINGATSGFNRQQDVLVKTIRGWMKLHATDNLLNQ